MCSTIRNMDPTPQDALAVAHLELVERITTLARAMRASSAPNADVQCAAACELLLGISEDLRATVEESDLLNPQPF